MKKWLLVSVLISSSFNLFAVDEPVRLSMGSDDIEFQDGPLLDLAYLLPDPSTFIDAGNRFLDAAKRVIGYRSLIDEENKKNNEPIHVSAVTDVSEQENCSETSRDSDDQDSIPAVDIEVPLTTQPTSGESGNQRDRASSSVQTPPSAYSYKSYIIDLLWRKHGFFGRAGLLTSASVLTSGIFYLLSRKTKAEKQMIVVKQISTEILIAIEQLDGPDPQNLHEQCDSLLNKLTALAAQLTLIDDSTKDQLRDCITALVGAIREDINALDGYHALIATLCACEQEIKIKGEQEANEHPTFGTRFSRWIKRMLQTKNENPYLT